jgi:predicted ATPase
MYVFKHSLIQDAAYQALLKARRQELHARVAAVLAAQPATEPELIARHYEEAGQTEEAVAHYQRAGEQATRRSENAEAIRHLTKGVELLRELPEGSERTRQELVLQVMLGAPLQAVKGFSNPAVEHAYGRARELCQEIGEAPQLFQALFGLTAFYQTRGQLAVAYEIGQQLLGLAERTGDASLILLGHMAVGNPLYWMGRPCEALEHLNQTIALYDPVAHRSLAYEYGQDPGVVARTFAALSLWMAGYPDQAERRSGEAIQLGRDSAHALSLAFSLGFAATLHWLRREPRRAWQCADELVTLSDEQSFPLWLGLGLVQRGWAQIASRHAERGNDDLHRGFALLATTGAEVGSSQMMAILADVQAAGGNLRSALDILDSALTPAHEAHGAFFDSELHRLKGDILLRSDAGAGERAEELFRKACQVARQQGAKSLELRASVSLGRLLRGSGRNDEARALVAGIYGWFTEGHATADLTEAGALLAELESPASIRRASPIVTE